jgi:hypothetical protein
MAVSGTYTAGECSYQQANDNPHISGGDASVHGYWLFAGGSCPSQAQVTVDLQAYWCDEISGCRWINVARGSGDYASGGGRGRRANARLTCASSEATGWRGVTDVDLPGMSDPSDVTYSTIVDLACRPYE